MLDELKFGEFITVMRKREKIKLRSFSQMLSLSPAYVSTMENGKRPAPSLEIQQKIAKLLNLSAEESAIMYDLAAKTKRRSTLPADIIMYIEEDHTLLSFLRKAKSLGYTGADLLKLI